MDAVFGKGNFRNEVIWKRTSNHNDAGALSGSRLIGYMCYGAAIRRDGARVPLSATNVKSKYRHKDERGRYGYSDLAGFRPILKGSSARLGAAITQDP